MSTTEPERDTESEETTSEETTSEETTSEETTSEETVDSPQTPTTATSPVEPDKKTWQ